MATSWPRRPWNGSGRQPRVGEEPAATAGTLLLPSPEACPLYAAGAEDPCPARVLRRHEIPRWWPNWPRGDAKPAAPDEDLVRQIQEGNGPAFAELLRLYAPQHQLRVQWLIQRGDLPPADEPDARNVAALALWSAARNFDLVQADRPVRCAFASYEYRVRNAALSSFVRGLKRAGKRLDRSRTAAEVLDDEHADDGRDDPLREVLARERADRVKTVLAELRDEDQEFARLLQEKLSERKIAVRLGISVKRVRGWKKRLLALLRARLAEFRP